MAYCLHCGSTHSADDVRLCKLSREESDSRATRASTRISAERMAKSTKESDTICSAMEDMSVSAERERNIQFEIDAMEREERLLALEAKRELLERRRAERMTHHEGAGRFQDGGDAPKPTVTTREDGYSHYGESRSRQRMRGHRHHRSSSGSASRSSSSTRRKRSKWAIRRFVVGGKDVKKLNAYELMGASIRWCLDCEDLSIKDHRAFLEHLNFISVRAMHDSYKDTAHIQYDAAVRKEAEYKGFAAFSQANNGASVIHYGSENMRQKKAGVQGAGQSSRRSGGLGVEKAGKRNCFRWNREGGCDKGEDECGFGHWCAKCGSKAHNRVKCTRD